MGSTNVCGNSCNRHEINIFASILGGFQSERIFKCVSVCFVYSTNRTTQERRPPPGRLSTCTLLPAVRRATRATVVVVVVVVVMAIVPAATAITVQERPVRRRVRRRLSHLRIRRTFTHLPHRPRIIIIHLYQRVRRLPRRKWIICTILSQLVRTPRCRRRRTRLWD